MSEKIIGHKPEAVKPISAEMPKVRKKEQLGLIDEIPVNILVSALPVDYTPEEVDILTSLLKY